ncbi:folylpolyglutamate synthase [Rhodosporidiobolus nylandii]
MPGISLGLSRIHRLLSLLSSPHTRVPVVHIAGTNGKGSVSAYLSSILSCAEPPLRVGRFNSPHLVDEWDCIRLPSSLPSRAGVLSPVREALFKQTKREVEAVSAREGVGATSFEILTATAFTLFARTEPPLDVAVVEVGMGGAEDATNVVPASQTLLSVVTAVELDHQKFLGDTVGEIASVKAGITREGGDVVLAQQAHGEAVEAVKRIAAERGARVWEAGVATPLPAPSAPSSPATPDFALPPPPLVSLPLSAVTVTPSLPSSLVSPLPPALEAHLPLPGSYQLSNAACAVLSAQLLRTLPRTTAMVPALGEGRVSDKAIREGVEKTKWEGRLSWLSLPAPLPLSSSATASATPPAHLPQRMRRLLLDGAHNPSSAALLASYLHSLPPVLKPSTLIFALSAPRAASSVLPALLAEGTGVRRIVCTGFFAVAGMEWVRAVPPAELAAGVVEVCREQGREDVEVLQAGTAEEALRLLDELEEGQGGTTLAAGSLYLVADVLRVQRSVAPDDEAGGLEE